MNADVNSATITYEESKELAQHQDPEIRAALAKRTDLSPEILYCLAEDKDQNVRRIVADNLAAPRQTDVLLARDADADVRQGLAAKIAKVAPDLPSDASDKLRQSTHQALEILAKDQIQVVRQVLSEAMKDVADAPADIVRTLARDLEIGVSGPVLENSPVLTDDDLIEIIEATPADGALNAIARRENLKETVADAIVATDDTTAIGDLLGNTSAQIREQTINDLIDKAPGVELWHKPLATRPKLPEGAAERMARFLADNLLTELQQRSDLDPSTLDRVKAVVDQRLSGGPPKLEETVPTPAQDFLNVDPPMNMVLRLYNARKLDSDMVGKALMSSDNGFVFAALIIKAGVEPAVGKRIFREKNPKGIMALCWKAHLPVNMAVQVQQRMDRLSPSEVIVPEGTDYPLTDDEMEWQLEFFRDLAAKN